MAACITCGNPCVAAGQPGAVMDGTVGPFCAPGGCVEARRGAPIIIPPPNG